LDERGIPMDYFQISGQREKGTQIVLEPEEWTEEQWQAFLDIFDLVEADRIVLADFMVEVYGTPKTEAK
jgi:hypothetical protein